MQGYTDIRDLRIHGDKGVHGDRGIHGDRGVEDRVSHGRGDRARGQGTHGGSGASHSAPFATVDNSGYSAYEKNSSSSSSYSSSSSTSASMGEGRGAGRGEGRGERTEHLKKFNRKVFQNPEWND